MFCLDGLEGRIGKEQEVFGKVVVCQVPYSWKVLVFCFLFIVFRFLVFGSCLCVCVWKICCLDWGKKDDAFYLFQVSTFNLVTSRV